jgi:protein phosphatase PTC2/3
MGAYLDAPITDLNPIDGSGSYTQWGACAMQGWRCGMEDAHICEEVKLPSGDIGYVFGIFDGHGGAEVAKFVETHFMK